MIVRRIYANLGLLIGGKAGAGLISLGYLLIAARALGPRDYGALVLMHGYVTAVAGIIEFPGWHAIVRYGAQAIEERDEGRLVRLLRFAGGIEILGGCASILSAAALAPLIGPHLGWPPEAQAFALPYAFAVLGTIRATPAGYLQLRGRFDLLGVHNMVAPLVRLAGAVAAAFAGSGLRGFLFAWLVAALAEWSVMWALGIRAARRDILAHRLLGPPTGCRSENPGLLRFMLAANADVTFSELSGRLVPLVVGWVLGPASAGLYAIAQRATVIFQQPAQILGQAAYREFAAMLASGGEGRVLLRAVAHSAGLAMLAGVPVVVIALFAGGPVARLLGGPAYAAAAGLIGILSVARFILLAAPPASAALTALGHPTWSVTANVGSSLLLLAPLPILLHADGVAGAGLQAVAQAAASTLFLWLLLHRALVRLNAPSLPMREAGT